MTTDYLHYLRQDWAYLSHTNEARACLERFRVAHGDLALEGIEDLRDVIRALEPRGGRSVVERAAIVRDLLIEASDPLLRRTLLQTLIPGMVSACRQLRFGEGVIDDPGEMLALAVAMTCEIITEWAGERRAYAAPDILSALRGRLRRWILKEKDVLQTSKSLDDVDPGQLDEIPVLERLAFLRQGPTRRLADLAWARIVDGRPWQELARQEHVTVATLRRQLEDFALTHLAA